jgi:anhydro-N-acetylmuramic acid kinase
MTLALGIMSGTSLDGVDVALVEIEDERTVRLLGSVSEPYSPSDRNSIRGVITDGGTAACAELDVLLGERFADVALRLCAGIGVELSDVEVVGSHGQTVWHLPGKVSVQVGRASIIAERLGVPVVSDFRSADIAAGGQGAPLVPMADAMLFAGEAGRILVNVGGMANVTWVPRAGALADVVAFDTGPGVAVIDGVTQLVDPRVTFDRDGERARRGTARRSAVAWALDHPFFDHAPPKSTGRETFGHAFAERLVAIVRDAGSATGDDAVATAVAVVAESIANQIERWVPTAREVVVSGGGARNPVLLDALRAGLGAHDVRLFDELYFDGDIKEAVAFAYLAWRTMRGLPGNVPSATGARGSRVLGSVTRVRPTEPN